MELRERGLPWLKGLGKGENEHRQHIWNGNQPSGKDIERLTLKVTSKWTAESCNVMEDSRTSRRILKGSWICVMSLAGWLWARCDIIYWYEFRTDATAYVFLLLGLKVQWRTEQHRKNHRSEYEKQIEKAKQIFVSCVIVHVLLWNS